MELILGGINGRYLRNITERAAPETELVLAAVAYASEASLLFDWCWENNLPLKFWGRYDDTVPVSLPILKTFLDRRSPNFVCKLLKHFHAKVIWWVGFGVYIGSANLSHAAWYQNIEAGTFFYHSDITSLGLEINLRQLFRETDIRSSPLTEELYRELEQRVKELTSIKHSDEPNSTRFNRSHLVQQWGGLKHKTTRTANDEKREVFLKEWWETLQVIRDIGTLVSRDENRPSWVNSVTPSGIQADQFLHAHYYHNTFDGRKANYEYHFTENQKNPKAALEKAVAWWRALKDPPSREDRTLNDWAPFLKRMLSPEKIRSLTSDELVEICARVHAIQEHARRVRNQVVGLPDGRKYSMAEKTTALAHYLYHQKSANGGTLFDTLAYVLDPTTTSETPIRLWNAVSDPAWQIEHLGISAFGELIGWALPDAFPVRNGRTSKALRSLGYDVTVHVE